MEGYQGSLYSDGGWSSKEGETQDAGNSLNWSSERASMTIACGDTAIGRSRGPSS